MGERRTAGYGLLKHSPNEYLREPHLLVDMSDITDCVMAFEIPRFNWIVQETLDDYARALSEGSEEALQSGS